MKYDFIKLWGVPDDNPRAMRTAVRKARRFKTRKGHQAPPRR